MSNCDSSVGPLMMSQCGICCIRPHLKSTMGVWENQHHNYSKSSKYAFKRILVLSSPNVRQKYLYYTPISLDERGIN